MTSPKIRGLLARAITALVALVALGAPRVARAAKIAGAVDHTLTNGVHVVTAPLDDAEYEVRVARPNAKKFADGLLDKKTVAAHAIDEGAIVAINANFFGGDRNHPCGLGRGHGDTFPTIYRESNCLTSLGWSTTSGAIFDSSALFGPDGKVTAPNVFPQFPDVVTGAGKLLEGGQARTPNFAKFEEGRNCTALGINATTKKIALVVTNRDECTAAKLRSAFTAAGITDAIHLDGGGSSKMWINGAYVDDELEDRKPPVVVVIRKRPKPPVAPDGGTSVIGDASDDTGVTTDGGDGAIASGEAPPAPRGSEDGGGFAGDEEHSDGCAQGGQPRSAFAPVACCALLFALAARRRRPASNDDEHALR